MITTKKHVMSMALGAVMLAGILHEGMGAAPASIPYNTASVVSADSSGGGSILQTKFFLPFRSEDRTATDNEQREALNALLTTYEQR